MTTRVAQVITWASACRCFAASERTRASVSLALASIRLVILSPSQDTSRVSRIVPTTSSTTSSPLPRAQWLIWWSGITTSQHSRRAALTWRR